MSSVSWGFLDPDSVLEAFGQVKGGTDDYIGSSYLGSFSAEWMPKSDEVSLAIFCNALEELGCPIRCAAAGEELDRITYAPSYEKLINHIYGQLEKRARLIKIEGRKIVRTDVPCPSQDIETPLGELLLDRPAQEAEIKIMRLMGSNYGKCLAGKVDAVQLLFGDPECRALLAKSYSASEMNSVLLQQLTDFIEAVAKSWPTKTAPLRILEIGAGTGGTTSWLLPVLARLDIPVVYTYTDVGPVFVNEASSTFKEYPIVEYKVLDIEQKPPAELQNTQHVVLGTNVVHATRDISKSLKNILQLLRPDGFLVIGEMTAQMLWCDVVYGLFAGFWRFEDKRQHALQNSQAWMKSCTSAGYGHCDWTQGQRPESLLQGLIFATASDPGFVITP